MHASAWLNYLGFQNSLGFLVLPCLCIWSVCPFPSLSSWSLVVGQVDLWLIDALGISSHSTSSRKTSLTAEISGFFLNFLDIVVPRLIPCQYYYFCLLVSLSKPASPWRQILCFIHFFVLSTQPNFSVYNAYSVNIQWIERMGKHLIRTHYRSCKVIERKGICFPTRKASLFLFLVLLWAQL